MAISLILTALALLVSALGLWGALTFLRLLRLPKVHRCGSSTLILPLTGNAPGIEHLLRALEAQSLPPRRLIVCVENTQDPAHRRIGDLAKRCAFPIQIVVAGHATQCAQKCFNQTAALRLVDAQDQAVVFLDADILPSPWWLSALATPLLDGSADLVTGYRWPVIAAPTLGAHLVASIDRAIALLPRIRSINITWGGSLALSPRALDALQAERILATTLSDDCTIGKHAGTLGLRT